MRNNTHHTAHCCILRDYLDENKTSLVPALLHRSNRFITPLGKGVSLSDTHVDEARNLEIADNLQIEDNPRYAMREHRGSR